MNKLLEEELYRIIAADYAKAQKMQAAEYMEVRDTIAAGGFASLYLTLPLFKLEAE